MIIIGVDFHPEFEQIAFVDIDIGEFRERRLTHREEAVRFYRTLAAAGVGGTCGHESQRTWPLVRTIAGELPLELWIGDAAEIQTAKSYLGQCWFKNSKTSSAQTEAPK